MHVAVGGEMIAPLAAEKMTRNRLAATPLLRHYQSDYPGEMASRLSYLVGLSSWLKLGCYVLALPQCACFLARSSVLAAGQAAGSADCAHPSVAVEDSETPRVFVWGCGKSRMYQCPTRDASSVEQCQLNDLNQVISAALDGCDKAKTTTRVEASGFAVSRAPLELQASPGIIVKATSYGDRLTFRAATDPVLETSGGSSKREGFRSSVNSVSDKGGLAGPDVVYFVEGCKAHAFVACITGEPCAPVIWKSFSPKVEAAAALNCPMAEVNVTPLSAGDDTSDKLKGIFEVEGCGRKLRILCKPGDHCRR